jgi:hypothetical protein
LTEEDNRATVLKAVKDRVRQSEDFQRVQMLADSIGDRRDRDLLDLLSWIEEEKGWPETLKHLLRAQDFSYSLPIGAGPNRTKVENLKFREMLFSVFGCRGLESISTSTSDLLAFIENERSLIDASNSLRNHVESIARNQIESGDTLFFDFNDLDFQVSKDIARLIERMRNEEIQGIMLERKADRINIAPLWQCETGRQALSTCGIKGYVIDSKRLEEVLSVIQFPVGVNKVAEYSDIQREPEYPSNILYRNLHNYIINQDDEGLSTLSSRHSFPTLRSMLEEALDTYNKDPSSENYRKVLHLIHIQVRVRTLESVQLLERLAHLKNIRISSVAIVALGNYYHESAVSALIEILCTDRNQEIVRTAASSILNIGKRCPETVSVITNALESSACSHKGRLKRVLKRLEKKKSFYYFYY